VYVRDPNQSSLVGRSLAEPTFLTVACHDEQHESIGRAAVAIGGLVKRLPDRFRLVRFPLAWMWRRKLRVELYAGSMDLRERHPDWQPPNGWSISRPRDPNGWVASWVDSINNDGTAHYDSNTETLIIERLGEDSFSEPWRIEVSEADLATYLAGFLDSDGTVYGIDDPDEPVDTDGMMAAFTLFLIHVDEYACSGDRLTESHWRLDPKRGLRPVRSKGRQRR